MILTALCSNILDAVDTRNIDTLTDIRNRIGSSLHVTLKNDIIETGIFRSIFKRQRGSSPQADQLWIFRALVHFQSEWDIVLESLPNIMLERIFADIVRFHIPSTLRLLRDVGNLSPQRAFEAGLIKVALRTPSVGLLREMQEGWGLESRHIIPGSDEDMLLEMAHDGADHIGHHHLQVELNLLL